MNTPVVPARIYRLKFMVIVRILAEIAMLVILIILPFLLAVLGKLNALPLVAKVVFCAMASISALILPWYGFITWKVKTDEEGITSFTVFRRHFCAWQNIKGLVRKSNWNCPRFVVEATTGDVSFPVWLESLDELVASIRSRLPQGIVLFNPYRRFNQDPLMLIIQFLQALGSVLFLVVFWMFFAGSLKSTNPVDSAILLAFCLLLTLALVWRTFMVVLMPISVELTRTEVVINTCLFRRRLGWENVLQVGPSLPLLPEGFVIKTRQGSFLIGNGMDRSDELEQAISAEITAHKALSQERS